MTEIEYLEFRVLGRVVVLATVVFTLLCGCQTDVGIEGQRFACDEQSDCSEGFECREVDNGPQKECVELGEEPTLDAEVDTADADDTTRADVPDDADITDGTDITDIADANDAEDADVDDAEDLEDADADCQGESDEAFCEGRDDQCGEVVDVDQCGRARAVDCSQFEGSGCEGNEECALADDQEELDHNECRCPDEGFGTCGGECVSLNSHDEHCGGCDQPCPEFNVCSGGTCECQETRSDSEVCDALGAECGSVEDRCGETVDCQDTCLSGEECDTNRCCTPPTCATDDCGSKGNLCGSVDCGECTSGQCIGGQCT